MVALDEAEDLHITDHAFLRWTMRIDESASISDVEDALADAEPVTDEEYFVHGRALWSREHGALFVVNGGAVVTVFVVEERDLEPDHTQVYKD